MIAKRLKKSVYRLSVAAFAAVLLWGCLTTMPANESAPLTECSHGNLNQVKRNLILLGYGIAHAAEGEIITDFMQLSESQNWQRVSAVKMGADRIKLIFRQRQSYNHPIALTHSRSPVGINKFPDSSFSSSLQYQSSLSEFDLVFYSEYKDRYVEQQKSICNTVPQAKGN